jgi:hypothetical protein
MILFGRLRLGVSIDKTFDCISLIDQSDQQNNLKKTINNEKSFSNKSGTSTFRTDSSFSVFKVPPLFLKKISATFRPSLIENGSGVCCKAEAHPRYKTDRIQIYYHLYRNFDL